jgi:hypothetical protein
MRPGSSNVPEAPRSVVHRAPAFSYPSVVRRFGSLLGVALVAAALTACGSKDKAAARLEGSWKGVRVEGLPAPLKASGDSYATALRIDIKGHDLILASPKGEQKSAFKVVSNETKTFVIVTEKDGVDAPQTFVLENETTLKWQVDPTKQIVFTK